MAEIMEEILSMKKIHPGHISLLITSASLLTPSSISLSFENEKFNRIVFRPESLQKKVEPDTNATFFPRAFSKITSESKFTGRDRKINNPPWGFVHVTDSGIYFLKQLIMTSLLL